MSRRDRPVTPDGRYFVSRGRLWRCTNPHLSPSDRRAAVKALMKARMAFRDASGLAAQAATRAAIDAAKHTLGESGPVWWDDGAPDESGRNPRETAYAGWWDSLPDSDRE